MYMSSRHSFPAPQQQRGAAVVLLLLLIAGVLALMAFSSDSPRMTGDAAQLKRATDAASLAAAMARATDKNADIQAIAQRYVEANLGMDQAQLNRELEVSATAITRDDAPGVRVQATFHAASMLASTDAQRVTVASTAVAPSRSLEVALMLPNTLSETAANLAALRRLGKTFAEELIADYNNTWLALVPYSQAVNLYDPDHPDRLANWATADGLKPVELTSLFNNIGGNMTNRRLPDRRYQRLCMNRGLKQGENYFWDQAPTGQFPRVYYRADLPDNSSIKYYLSWLGPNPDFGEATGITDTRTMIVDHGCPVAPLLPLTNDQDKIDQRLDQMETGFNTNYAIGLGWAAMALAPAFRGGAGWGLEDDLPKDFDTGDGDRTKAIVMLVNSSDKDWYDSDAYNSYVGKAIDGCSTDGGNCSNINELIVERFSNLCTRLREKHLRVFVIVTGNNETPGSEASGQDDDGTLSDASGFRRYAGKGLRTCSKEDGDITYYDGFDFVASEGPIENRLKQITELLRKQSNYVQLVQ